MSNPAPRILVIRRRYLGDLILLGSVLDNLRRHWPAAHVSVLAEAAYLGVLAMNPKVDETLAFPHSAAEWWALWRRLRSQGFDLVLDFDNRDKTAVITLASGAKRRLALHHGGKVHLGWMYTEHEIVAENFLAERHVTDLYHQLLVRAGVPVANRDIGLHPLAADIEYIGGLPELAALPKDRPRLLVHPGSRSTSRIWPAEKFAAVLNQVQAENLASVTLVAGPAELHFIDEVQRQMNTPVVCLRQQFSLPQLGALLAGFDLLLCHDSGPMHLAAAVGTRVVALLGSQANNIFAPLGTGHVCLSPPMPCINCAAPEACVVSDSYRTYCVRNIPPAEVIQAVRAGLAARDLPSDA